MIPTFGVRRTLLIFGALLFAASLWGLRPRWGQVRLCDCVALVVVPLGPLKDIPYLIYDQESLYNYIQVTQLPDGTRDLSSTREKPFTRSTIPTQIQLLTGWYWDYFLAAPYFNTGFKPQQLHRVGIIGLAAARLRINLRKCMGRFP